MNLFHLKIRGTVFLSNSLHTKWFSWCLLKILIRNSRRGASVRKRISNFSSKEFSLGEPFILIYIFPGKWWNFDLNKQGGEETWLRRKMATSKNKYFSMALTTWWKDSSGCQEWRKIDGNILFFSAADLPQECRTRRSYSLDRIHLYDSYFPFPFRNKYLLLSLSNDFLPRISLRKLFWSEVFAAINLLANDPECNLSRQWHPN